MQKISKYYFWFSALFFIISILVGVLNRSSDSQVENTLRSSLPFISSIRDLPSYLIFFVILFNNVLKSFLALAFGVVFGIFPIYSLFANGFLIGLVGAYFARHDGLGFFLASILPHGVIELPVLVTVSAYGMWLGAGLIRWILRRESLRPAFVHAMKVYVYKILPLVFIAALIESFLTPQIIKWLGY